MSEKHEITGYDVLLSLQQPASSTQEITARIDNALKALKRMLQYPFATFVKDDPSIPQKVKETLSDEDPILDFLENLSAFIKNNINNIQITKLIDISSICFKLFVEFPSYQPFVEGITELIQQQIKIVEQQIDEPTALEQETEEKVKKLLHEKQKTLLEEILSIIIATTQKGWNFGIVGSMFGRGELITLTSQENPSSQQYKVPRNISRIYSKALTAVDAANADCYRLVIDEITKILKYKLENREYSTPSTTEVYQKLHDLVVKFKNDNDTQADKKLKEDNAKEPMYRQ